MLMIPDLTDPRYLREVGWFLRYEKFGPFTLAEDFEGERLEFSRLFLREVLEYVRQKGDWIKDKTVVSVGCGCTGDLATWPAAVKIGVDPLANVYRDLEMLPEDVQGTARTVYLAVGAERLPLVDRYADLVVCRNALDHMLDPGSALEEIARILKSGGVLFLSVDFGGRSTPDEPTVLELGGLRGMIESHFEIQAQSDAHRPFSGGKEGSLRILAKKKEMGRSGLDKRRLLAAYLDSLGEEELVGVQAVGDPEGQDSGTEGRTDSIKPEASTPGGSERM